MTNRPQSNTDVAQPARPPMLSGGKRFLVLAAAGLAIALLSVIAALSSTGELIASVLLDPGALVRYGLPVSRTMHDLAAAATVGTATLACFALPAHAKDRTLVGFHQWRASRWAAVSAACWAISAVAVLIFTTADTIGIPLSEPGFSAQVVFFSLNLELGQTRVASLVLVVLAALLLMVPRSVNRLGWGFVASMAALLPLALGGHAAGADEHANAVNSLALHFIGVYVWVGGLATLIALAPRLKEQMPAVVRRYSALALAAYAMVLISGGINGLLRLASPAHLISHSYGRLLLIKIVLFTVLGLIGWWHRSRLVPALAEARARRRTFIRLAVGEVLLMALVVGISVGMAASAPPVSQEPVTYDVRHALLFYPWPPPLTAETYFTQTQMDWVIVVLALAAIGGYLFGVHRLRGRGVSWPVGRTISWIAGCLVLIFFTSGGPAVYGKIQFSAHMIQHMALMMYIPMLLVLGAPILLTLRVLAPRRDSSRGIREWLLVVLHSRYSHFLTRPVVAATIFAGSLVAFYFTGWFEWSMANHAGHVLMTVHFLLSGYLFFWVILGVDPGPDRPPHAIRLVVLLVTMAFHAFFGIAIMSSNEIFAEQWWRNLGWEDTQALQADQSRGGAIAWGAGELPVVLAALVVMFQWVRSDERTARRQDRKAARDGGQELQEYNEHLRRLHEQSVADDER